MQSIEILNVENLYSSFFKLNKVSIKHTVNGDVALYDRELFARGDAVTVLPYDYERRKVLLTKQFRIGAHRENDPFLLETIAGIIETGESSFDVAKREAEEEAGLKLSDLELVLSCYPSPGACDEKIDIYLSSFDSNSYSAGQFGLDSENEFIETILVDFDELEKMLKEGAIKNGITVIAIQALLLKIVKDKIGKVESE